MSLVLSEDPLPSPAESEAPMSTFNVATAVLWLALICAVGYVLHALARTVNNVSRMADAADILRGGLTEKDLDAQRCCSGVCTRSRNCAIERAERVAARGHAAAVLVCVLLLVGLIVAG